MSAAGDTPRPRQRLTPYFTVADADRLIGFLVSAFDGRVIRESRHPDGTVAHARVAIGDSLVMLNQAGGDYAANVSQMHLEVDDADAAYDRALRCGARPLMAPNVRPHGDRMAGVHDPCGNIWWLASPK